MTTASNLWRLERVTLQGRPQPRLDDVTLDVPAGVTAVLGPSGAGKSSLLSLLVGFETPGSGRIIRCQPAATGQADLFWGPPDDGLWPHLTVREHLTTVAPAGTSAARIDGLLKDFDLAALVNARPERLSLGERSRLNVVRALATEASILVLDEPLSHVEAGRQVRFWQALRRKLQQSGSHLVFATHDREAVLREAANVICLEAGRPTYAGSVAELYHRPPSLDLAELLGPANWLDGSDRTRWLGDSLSERHPCIRPESLVVEAESDGPCELLGSQRLGQYCESRVRQDGQNLEIRLLHRVPERPLDAGGRVRLRLLPGLLLLLLALVPGCGGSADPVLSAHTTDSWSLPAHQGRMPAPRGIGPGPDRTLYVLDNAGRVLVYDEAGELLRDWWMPDYDIGKAEGVCVLQDGRVAVADTHYHRVVVFDRQGIEQLRFGKLGEGPGEFIYPVKVIQSPSGTLFVCEYGGHDRVQMFRPDGTYVGEFGRFGTAPGEFQRPSGIVWRDGLLYVVDAFNNRVQVFTELGQFVKVIADGTEGASLYYPYDVTLTPDDRLLVVEYGGSRVTAIDLDGKLLGRFGTPGGGENQLMTPWGLTVDSQGRLLICDTGNRRLVRLEL